ncbi:hypothetical protein CDD83_7014 [Cordyceps sp. RAO-2017]|nr:hypothetical protein CDD83_7014 [Cordyceps sp. RAO-2017]
MPNAVLISTKSTNNRRDIQWPSSGLWRSWKSFFDRPCSKQSETPKRRAEEAERDAARTQQRAGTLHEQMRPTTLDEYIAACQTSSA